MESNKLVVGIITTAIVVILTASALMPVISDATTAERTFINSGRYYITTEISAETTVAMDYTVDGGRVWYVDGVELEYETISGFDYERNPSVIGSTDLVFRTDGRIRGLISNTGSSGYQVTVTADAVTTGSTTGGAPLFIASTAVTDAVMRYSSSTESYLLEDSPILGCGYTTAFYSESSSDTESVVVSLSGSIEDGVQISLFSTAHTYTAENISLNAASVSGYDGLYTFESVTFDAVESVTGTVTPMTYSIIIIPAEVTAPITGAPTPGQIALYNAIPVMIFVALIVGVIGYGIYRNRD